MSAPIVVKLGGEVVRGRTMGTLARDLAEIAATRPLVIVHGGGAQSTELGARLGVPVRKVAGLRVTDDATLEVVKLALSGVNVELCAALGAAGVRAVGLTGASALAIRATRRAPLPTGEDLGHVGDVAGVESALFGTLTAAGYVPVLACLGCDELGALYNINADTVATQVARALHAAALVLVSDVPGVLRDAADPRTRMPRLDAAHARAEIAAGTITRGMAVKLEEAFAALAAGVPRIHIVGALAAGDLAAEMREPGSRGTVLVP